MQEPQAQNERQRSQEFFRLVGLWSKLIKVRNWKDPEYQVVILSHHTGKRSIDHLTEQELRKLLLFYKVGEAEERQHHDSPNQQRVSHHQ